MIRVTNELLVTMAMCEEAMHVVVSVLSAFFFWREVWKIQKMDRRESHYHHPE